jgi:uncharacterized protein YbcI
MLLVRLTSVLTAAEQQLVIRTQLIETSRERLESLVESITTIKVVSIHHDISTVTGEEIILFTLAGPPKVREAQKRGARLVPQES